MNIESPTFLEGDSIPILYTADGQDVSPPITITDIPKEANSLVLVVEDPDAKKIVGYSWIHWIVFNIPISNHEYLTMPEAKSLGVRGRNSFGNLRYGGPNPPKGSGVHHYHFKVFALKGTLDLREGCSAEELEEKMEPHVLEGSELIGVYSKN